MAKIPSLSSSAIIQALRRRGFQDAPKRGKGSHTALVGRDAAGRVRLVIIPHRKDVPTGTLLAIIEQAGLTKAEFLDSL